MINVIYGSAGDSPDFKLCRKPASLILLSGLCTVSIYLEDN